MDKPIKIERIVMMPGKSLADIHGDKVSAKFGIAFAKHKSEMLVRAILDELKSRNVPEAFIVNPEFVEQAIREKLIADQRRDETDKLGEAIETKTKARNGRDRALRELWE